MNYGPCRRPPNPCLHFEGVDEPDLLIQLYHHVASATELLGREVLEAGSGRGGGAMTSAPAITVPARLTGVDFSPGSGGRFSSSRHAGVANVSFLAGDAEALPFPDASFDIVINVESSHSLLATSTGSSPR